MIEKFLEYLNYERRVSQRTLIAYSIDIKEYADFLGEDIRFALPEQLRSYVIYLSDRSLSHKSINRKMSVLKSFYRFLIKIDEIEVNPTLGLHSLKEEKKQQIPFSCEELDRLFSLAEFSKDNFHSLRDALILELFYTTGIRRAELIGIKLSDIDFSHATLRVFGKRQKHRIIPLLPSVLNRLKKYMDYRSQQLTQVTSTQELHLFIRSSGGRLSERFLYQLVHNYLSKVSVKRKRSPHILRHSFATHMLDNRADLRSVQSILGHASLRATQIYTHNSIQKLREVFQVSHPRAVRSKK